jgi:uncharacterized protein (TIGR03435 family)
MVRIAAFSLVAILAAPTTSSAQNDNDYYRIDTTTATASFEAASIKRNLSGRGALWGVLPGRLRATTTVDVLMRYAFAITSSQLVAPEWTKQNIYDIDATFPSSPSSETVIRGMVRKLLAERFGLVFRVEERPTKVYALILLSKDGQLGPQLKRTTTDCVAAMSAPKEEPRKTGEMRPFCSPGKILAKRTPEGYVYIGGGFDIRNLARSLTGPSGRLVVDRTGLTGTFDFQLQYTPSEQLLDEKRRPEFVTTIFAALRDQLGLTLVDAEAMVDSIVVSQLTEPTPN